MTTTETTAAAATLVEDWTRIAANDHGLQNGYVHRRHADDLRAVLDNPDVALATVRTNAEVRGLRDAAAALRALGRGCGPEYADWLDERANRIEAAHA